MFTKEAATKINSFVIHSSMKENLKAIRDENLKQLMSTYVYYER